MTGVVATTFLKGFLVLLLCYLSVRFLKTVLPSCSINARLAKSFPCHAFWPLPLAFNEIKGQTITMTTMQMIGENIV